MSHAPATINPIPEGVDPGHEKDTPTFRHCRPPKPCVGLVPAIATGGAPRWVDGSISHWQLRRWGKDGHYGPDGWWAYCLFHFDGRAWQGWLHETEVRPVKNPAET